MYSALKKDGRPLYDYARAGETVERVPRVVQLHALELRGFWGRKAPVSDDSGRAFSEPPSASGTVSSPDGAASARIFIRCSKGTYVRSLAHDLGRVLGTGAHLAALRRTRSGPFSIQEAISPEALQGAPLPVISPADALRHLPTVTVSPDVARDLGHGKVVTWARAQGDGSNGATGSGGDLGGALVRILTATGELLAVAPSGASGDVIRTVRVFHSSNEAPISNSVAQCEPAL
jgi:tRNA pseudouridine55 synthase